MTADLIYTDLQKDNYSLETIVATTLNMWADYSVVKRHHFDWWCVSKEIPLHIQNPLKVIFPWLVSGNTQQFVPIKIESWKVINKKKTINKLDDEWQYIFFISIYIFLRSGSDMLSWNFQESSDYACDKLIFFVCFLNSFIFILRKN